MIVAYLTAGGPMAQPIVQCLIYGYWLYEAWEYYKKGEAAEESDDYKKAP